MARKQSIDIRRSLKDLFPDSFLENAARQTGFFRRRRKLDVVAFFWNLVLGFAVGPHRSISSLRRSYDAATSGNIENEVTFTYNGFGQVTQSAQEHQGEVDMYTWPVVYSYSAAESGDPVSRLNFMQYPFGTRRVYVHYDASDGGTDYAKMDWVLVRPSAVSNSSTPGNDRLADYTYQGLTRVVSRLTEEPSADVTVTRTYDRFGRVDTLIATNAGTINSFAYGYNRDSSVLWREENQSSGKDERYEYDSLERLVEFERGDLNQGRTDIGSPARNQQWGLDLVGNWQTIETDGDEVPREHNLSNEITDIDKGEPGGDPTYDDNGNTLSAQRGHPGYSGRIYRYDGWNRLVGVDFVSPSATVAEYSYDGLGRRIYDAVSDLDYYYSEGWQVISERDRSEDDTVREYVWGVQYVDEILARDEDKTSDGDTRDAADETVFYIQDANWNVCTLVSEAGSPEERYLYDAYGLPSFFDESWSDLGGSSAYDNQVLFTGRWFTESTFTYDYRHREYSPYLGRFLQRDPIGAWGDRFALGNAYTFLGGSPLVVVDPTGLAGVRATAEVSEEADKKAQDRCKEICDKAHMKVPDDKGAVFSSTAATQADVFRNASGHKYDPVSLEWVPQIEQQKTCQCNQKLKFEGTLTITVSEEGSWSVKVSVPTSIPGSDLSPTPSPEVSLGGKTTTTVVSSEKVNIECPGDKATLDVPFLLIARSRETWTGWFLGFIPIPVDKWENVSKGGPVTWCHCERGCPKPATTPKCTEETPSTGDSSSSAASKATD